MPIINITTWETDNSVKKTLIEKITSLYHEETGAPLDKITVYFQEVNKESWGEAGILGSSKEFPIKSRRKDYSE